MKELLKTTAIVGLFAFSIAGCKDDDVQAPGVVSNVEVTLAAGDSSAVIGKVNQFREITGNPLNSVPTATFGRREINWDGVPSEAISPLEFPPSFFNPTDPASPAGRKRGLVYVPANVPLLVSDKNFSEIDPSYASEFKAFSKNKLFIAKGSIITEIEFRLPGTNTPAYVSSFGLIFSDVDNPKSTVVRIYEGDKLLWESSALAADKAFSFVGLHSTKNKITRVKIISGNAALAKGTLDSPIKDLVVMDDFIYSEPKAY